MENFSEFAEDEEIDLPPGFRFHPTDEELITHYLSKKVLSIKFSARAIGEVDMNKVEPWEMPWRAKLGENEWYFFCLRDKKYPTGLRTNRATASGYWKATGKDKEIFRGKSLVGMKKTLVFYKGRAPKGEKTNWVIHEYRIEGKLSLYNLPKTAKNEWVILRVFQKTSDGKKVPISGLVGLNPNGNGFAPVLSETLIDSSPHIGRTKPGSSESIHVHCFSNPIDYLKSQEEEMMNYLNSPSEFLPNLNSWAHHHVSSPWQGNLQSNGGIEENEAILKGLLQTNKEMLSASHETGLSNEMNAEISSVVSNLEMVRRSNEEQMAAASTSTGQLLPIHDSLWNY